MLNKDGEEGKEPTTTPLPCTRVELRCWLTIKPTERTFLCWGILSSTTKTFLSAECSVTAWQNVSESSAGLWTRTQRYAQREKVNHLALLPSLLIWQVSAMRKECGGRLWSAPLFSGAIRTSTRSNKDVVCVCLFTSVYLWYVCSDFLWSVLCWVERWKWRVVLLLLVRFSPLSLPSLTICLK